MRVKNLHGTAKRKPIDGSSSWLDFWHKHSHRSIPYYCAAHGCANKAEVGAHVITVYGDDRHWYIVPACRYHNGVDEPYDVDANDMVPVNPNDWED